jgi:DNA-binding beta-propeller fold protein YncE
VQGWVLERGPLFVLLLLAVSAISTACGGEDKASGRAEPAPGEMVSVAGGGGELGDGGPASLAGFCGPGDVALDADGNLYIADLGIECQGPGGNSVREIDPAGLITTVAGGTGVLGFGGDGGPATKAQLNVPSAVAVGRDGGLYISDQDNHRIRKVGLDGIITTVAGTGEQGHSGDGGPARRARLSEPGGLAFDTQGNLYVAEFAAVRQIDRAGRITTVAGTGKFGHATSADDVPLRLRSAVDGPAIEARLTPIDVAVDRHGAIYISDFHSGLVHKVNRDGIIKTVAGSRTATRVGDGGPATSARLNDPWGIAVDARGNLFIAEHHGERIRKVDRDGTITTIAGTGEPGFTTDRGTATELELFDPGNLLTAEPGLLYITDYFNHRVWLVRYRDS